LAQAIFCPPEYVVEHTFNPPGPPTVKAMEKIAAFCLLLLVTPAKVSAFDCLQGPAGMSQQCTRARSAATLEGDCTCEELELGLAFGTQCGAPPLLKKNVRSAEAAKGCDTGLKLLEIDCSQGPPASMGAACTSAKTAEEVKSKCTCDDLEIGRQFGNHCGAPPAFDAQTRAAEAEKNCPGAVHQSIWMLMTSSAPAQGGYWMQLASVAQTQAPQSNKDTTTTAAVAAGSAFSGALLGASLVALSLRRHLGAYTVVQPRLLA